VEIGNGWTEYLCEGFVNVTHNLCQGNISLCYKDISMNQCCKAEPKISSNFFQFELYRIFKLFLISKTYSAILNISCALADMFEHNFWGLTFEDDFYSRVFFCKYLYQDFESIIISVRCLYCKRRSFLKPKSSLFCFKTYLKSP